MARIGHAPGHAQIDASVETTTIHTIRLELPLPLLREVKSQDEVRVVFYTDGTRDTAPKRLTYREVHAIAEEVGNTPSHL